MEGISTGPTQTAKAPKSNNTLKMTIAIALLVVAGGVISIYEGWIPLFTEEKPAPPTQEQVQAVQQREQHIQQQIKQGAVITNGAN
jgi:hypothetical protein